MPPSKATDRRSIADGRYRVQELLGEGGLASVFRVIDSASGVARALKLLRPREEPDAHARNIELFEREFHTLAHLAHPRTVAVYDYGFEDGTPYYTMDLLDGGDLMERAPLDARTACAIARDVCSALSLLHSRRLVYRDLSPRNVRCTEDGKAKLIDFGAVVPMGPSKTPVGTPAFCAPEVIDLQPLDARTDLYALGATLYFTLTRRRPYPARNFRQLRELWATTPPRPSELVSAIPPALDDLVMSLIELEPALRPSSAAEVMERLSGIASLPADEQLQVSQAYLTTPTLVGRRSHLSKVRRALGRAAEGRGTSIVLRGAAGTGRSRLVDSCALIAKISGVTVLRGDAEDGQQGDYGVVRALAAQLLDHCPEQAAQCAQPLLSALGHALPQLLESRSDVELCRTEDPALLRAEVQSALRTWFEAVSHRRPLLLAIDDVHRIDEPSAAFIAMLARSTEPNAVLIVATADDQDVRSAALSLLFKSSTELTLGKLKPRHSEGLLAALFGQVPHLTMLARRLHRLSDGNPRDIMRLAQHLVDNGLIRYEAGSWSLPASVDDGDLPSSMAEALSQSVAALSPEARVLAQALALCPDQSFHLDDCLLLSGNLQQGRVVQLLNELSGAEIVKRRAEHCELAQRRWVPALHEQIDDEETRRLHGRLCEVFERRGDQIRLTHHLLKAGRPEQAIDVLVQHARESQEQTDPSSEAFIDLVMSLPRDWVACYDQALSLCESIGRPASETFYLRSRMAGLVSVAGTSDTSQLSRLLARLEQDSGLSGYRALPDELEPAARLQRALEQAQAAFEQTDERQRVLDPISAIRQLARTLIQCSAVTVTTRNLSFFRELPSLQPYVGLSPALSIVDKLLRAVELRCTGRSEGAMRLYEEIIERTSQPDRAGLDESHHRHGMFGVRFGMGMLHAASGFDTSLMWAEQIESNPMYEVNAWTVRMLHRLWQGELEEADRCRGKADELRVQYGRQQFFEGSHISIELAARAAAGDLLRVKQCIALIEPLAEAHPGWRPILHYGRGEYHRLRGDFSSALSELESSLQDPALAGHEMWAEAASSHVRVLVGMERHEEAVACGKRYLAATKDAGFGCSVAAIESSLALALVRVGNREWAIELADAAIALLRELGSTGLRLAAACAVRAEVAWALADAETARRCAREAVAAFGRDADPRIVARYRALGVQRTSQRHPMLAALGAAAVPSSEASQIYASISQCQSAYERAQHCLMLLARTSGARHAVWYELDESGEPFMVAQVGTSEVPSEVENIARGILNSTPDMDDTGTMSQSGPLQTEHDESIASTWGNGSGQRYHPVPVRGGGGSVGALAVLISDEDASFTYPGRVAWELSRIAQDEG